MRRSDRAASVLFASDKSVPPAANAPQLLPATLTDGREGTLRWSWQQSLENRPLEHFFW